MSALPSQVTSTIQRLALDLGVQIKTALSLADDVEAIDLDDFLNIADETTGKKPATTMQVLTCTPTPRDPMYAVVFLIGFKVGDDVGGFRMMKAMDVIFSLLPVGKQIDVKDYMVDESVDLDAAPITAVLTVSEATLLDQLPEVVGLLRMYAVTCQCLNLQS